MFLGIPRKACGGSRKLMEKNQKTTFLKNSLVYSSFNVISQFIKLLKEFMVRRILPPEIMGFWSFSLVVQNFVGTFDFGCITGATRELPIMRGRGNKEEGLQVRSTTFWFTIIQNMIVGIFASLYVWWNRAGFLSWEIIAAYVGIAVFFFMTFQLVYATFFSTAQAFVPLGKLLLIGSIIDGISFPLSAYLWGLKGVMVVAVISACLKGALYFISAHRLGLQIKPIISLRALKGLLSFGFFLRLIDYPNALFSMASILWVTAFMNIESLALFSMSRSFFLQVMIVTTSIGTIYSMRFLEQGGKGTDKDIMAKELKRYLLFQLLVVVPLLCWAAGVLLPFIVRNFIPKYQAANQAFLIMLICGFFYVLNSGLTNPWVLEKKLVLRGVANIAGLIMMIAVLSITWFFLGKRGIDYVAYSALAGHFLYFVYMVIAVGREIWRPKELTEIILSVSIAAMWVFAVLNIGHIAVGRCEGFIQDFKATLFMGSWTLLAILPIPIYGLKASSALKKWLWARRTR